jgi:translation initiation factor 2A
MTTLTQFAYRTQKEIGIVNGAPVYERLPAFEKPEGNLRCCSYSPCGRYFAWASPEKVNIIDANVGKIIATLPAENVYELGFSPLGTYVITWQRPSKDDAGEAVKNLKVWRVVEEPTIGDDAQRETIGKFVQKSQTGWNLQYTFDERFCARVVTNEVQIYESHDLTKVWNKLRVEGVADFAVSPGKNHSIAVFVPERKVKNPILYVMTTTDEP